MKTLVFVGKTSVLEMINMVCFVSKNTSQSLNIIQHKEIYYLFLLLFI